MHTTGKSSLTDFLLFSTTTHFITSKSVHHDRNGHFARNFIHYDPMISSLAKVMGLQSRQKQGPKNTIDSKNMVLGVEK